MTKSLLPRSICEFNSAKIQISDPDILWDHCGILFPDPQQPEVDKRAFMEAVPHKTKWYGPFKHPKDETYEVISINDSGDNNYYVSLSIELEWGCTREISFCCHKDTSQISARMHF